MSATCATQAVTQCCLRNCVTAFTPAEIEQHRVKLHSKIKADQDTYLVEKLQRFHSHMYIFKGRTVCRAAFCFFYGIGHERLTNLHAYIDGSRESAKQRSAIEWITSCVIESHLCEPLVGERAVDRDGNQRLILPASETLSDLYTRMIDDLMADDVGAEKIWQIPSMRTFYRVLEKKFPFILHECITTQTRCTICDKLRRSKADALRGGDPALTSSLIGTIDAHTKLHLGERQYQDHKYAKARNFPAELGAGCAKYALHIMGIQDLGNQERAIYLYPDIWNNNIVLSILHQNLTRMFLPIPLARQTGTAKNCFRYKKLYLTFDNAAVNKCMTSFLYCGMLVAKQWDQLFSSLHYPLHAQDALTVPAFLELCRCAYQRKPVSLFVLDVVWDWQDYFSPCLHTVKWQHIEDCFGFKISVGVPTGADAAHESVCKEISEIIKILPPSESARSWWKCLIDHPAAVFPGPNPASSLWDENNFWSTTGFIPCNARLTVPPITTQASVFLSNLHKLQSHEDLRAFSKQEIVVLFDGVTHETIYTSMNPPHFFYVAASYVLWHAKKKDALTQRNTLKQVPHNYIARCCCNSLPPVPHYEENVWPDCLSS
ncbi:hypothetical protein Pelo_17503 [Pelomyxa schiedti]|nr:hypothetical protein Pelo_17503 [Pelomyxa schiedti]